MSRAEKNLHRLENRIAIIEHLYSYCRHADLLDAEGMADHFTDNCSVCYGPEGPTITGKSQLSSVLSEALLGRLSSLHMITNQQVEFVSPDEALLHTNMYSWKRFEGYPEKADMHRYGRYDCRLVRTGSRWLFSHMSLFSAGEYGDPRAYEQFGLPWPAALGAPL